MVTVGIAKTSRLRRIAGACPNSADFLELLNDAIRMLIRRGNWWATVQRMTGCIYNNCLVWPRQVGSVLALNRCGHSIPPKNHWYGFSAVLPEDVQNQGRCGDRCWGDVAARENGTTSVFNQIPCLNDRYLQFYCMQPTDVGKKITIFGVDANGQTIRSLRSDGTYQDGLVLTLAIPYVQTPYLIRRVDRVLKDPTDGMVHGYQFDGSTLYDLAHYDPQEIAPDYRQSRIMSGCPGSRPGCCPGQITALVKLAYTPVVYDDDWVMIENLDALAMMMQAIKQSDNYDSDESEKMVARAVHEMNLELRDRLQLDQTVVNFQPYGTASLNRVRVGRML